MTRGGEAEGRRLCSHLLRHPGPRLHLAPPITYPSATRHSAERLLLQRALDGLGRVIYCPREGCGQPVIPDAEAGDGDAAPSTALPSPTRGNGNGGSGGDAGGFGGSAVATAAASASTSPGRGAGALGIEAGGAGAGAGADAALLPPPPPPLPYPDGSQRPMSLMASIAPRRGRPGGPGGGSRRRGGGVRVQGYDLRFNLSGLTLLRCSYCDHAFCQECRRAWHGQTPCGDLLARFRAADDAGREELKKR